jgi:hypothetical protein
MNLPIGKLFYFVPKIQGYNGGTPQTPENEYTGESGAHYAPIGAANGPTAADGQSGIGYGANSTYGKKNLYDLFYEGNEGQLDPPGLFDYSKGQWSAMTVDTTLVVWSNGVLTSTNADIIYNNIGNVRKVIVKMCGFASAGTGKLIGPDGNEYDSETFLSDLRLYANTNFGGQGSPCNVLFNPNGDPNSLLFRVVTQQYGQGIVQDLYSQQQAPWPTDAGNISNGGNNGYYNNICDPTGCIYLEVDLSCPVCADCDATSLDGYTGTTVDFSGLNEISAVFRRYKELEFEDKIGVLYHQGR